MNKPTQQQVIEAYKRLPPPVQEFLADPDKLARVLTDIRNAHSLHIDVVGQISESIGYLLLGLVGPSEFRDVLKIVGVSEGTANDIINEINQKIFVPLREEMRKSQVAEVKPPQPQRSELRNVLASVTKEVPHAPLGTSQGTAKLLEDHEEPHIEFKKTAAPPANLPGVIHHPPLPTPPPILPTKPYSSDPYREPIDEK